MNFKEAVASINAKYDKPALQGGKELEALIFPKRTRKTIELSMDFLWDEQITIEKDDTKECGYLIRHFGCTRWGNYKWRELTPTISTTKHKYGKDKQYYIVSWSSKRLGRMIVLPLHRLLYVYFVAKNNFDNTLDVDHINNDPLDNRIENLQAISRKDNIAKRGVARNKATANMTDEEILEARAKRLAKIKNK